MIFLSNLFIEININEFNYFFFFFFFHFLNLSNFFDLFQIFPIDEAVVWEYEIKYTKKYNNKKRHKKLYVQLNWNYKIFLINCIKGWGGSSSWRKELIYVKNTRNLYLWKYQFYIISSINWSKLIIVIMSIIKSYSIFDASASLISTVILQNKSVLWPNVLICAFKCIFKAIEVIIWTWPCVSRKVKYTLAWGSVS